MRKVLLLIFCIFLFSKPCFPARPLSTDDTATTEKGGWEIEFGLTYEKQIEKGFDEDEQTYYKNLYKNTGLELGIKYGVLKNLDLGLVIPYIFIDKNSDKDMNGFEDIIIQTKSRLFEEKAITPSYALGLNLKTKSGNEDKDLGTRQIEVEINNIFSKSIDRLVFHLNLGYNFLTKRKGQDDTFSYGLAFEYPLRQGKLNLVGEFIGETNFEGNFDKNPASLLLGFNYTLTDWFVFDIGCSGGISEAAPEYVFICGVTLNF
ncbi:MAG: transporter [Candidatus Omnitrophica bacterium]|nr:transporter [Candidatus Omnitrophota bacterium]